VILGFLKQFFFFPPLCILGGFVLMFTKMFSFSNLLDSSGNVEALFGFL
jgi:hypothetical protein